MNIDRIVVAAASAALLSVASGCMMSPHHGKVIPARTTSTQFTLYATQAGATITIDCAEGYFGSWQTSVINFTAGSSPFTLNGETVYSAGGSRVIPFSCWSPGTIHGRYMTRLRPKQNGSSMRVYNQDGLDCLGAALGSGDGPITAGNACGMKFSNSNNFATFIHVHADS